MMTMASGAMLCKISCDSGERIFSGWCTGTAAASAASFTGETETCIPRPLGRSGCVTTAAISNSGCVSKCFSVGTANCGVPQNTTFIRRLSFVPDGLPLAQLPHFLDFVLDQVALEHAQVLDEEDAVQVVDLMAERAGQQIFAANLERLALSILRLYGDELRPDHVTTKAGNGQAAFLLALFAFVVNHLGIRQHHSSLGILAAGYVNHGYTQVQANLRSGQTDPLRCIHRREHVLGELQEVSIKVVHRCRRFLENAIAVFDDRVDFPQHRK